MDGLVHGTLGNHLYGNWVEVVIFVTLFFLPSRRAPAFKLHSDELPQWFQQTLLHERRPIHWILPISQKIYILIELFIWMIHLGALTIVSLLIVFSIRVIHLGALMAVQMTIVTSICITICVFIIYVIIFANIWVMGLSFILVSTIRPDIAPGIIRTISISMAILASS